MTAPRTGEVLALRNAAAFCRHGLRQLVAVSGHDALPWLDRLLSQPVASISQDRAVAAVFMDGKGRLRADVRVLALDDPHQRVWLELPADDGKLLKLLDMFVIQDDVALSSAAGQLSLVTVAGPQAGDVLRAAAVELPEADRITHTNDGVAAVCSRLAGVPGYDLLGSDEALDRLLAGLSSQGLAEVSVAALDCVRIAAGVPWFANDLAGDVIPLEALLDDHVSVTKGCYPGQEIVARITNRGQVSRKLVRLSAAAGSAPAPGTELQGCGQSEGKSGGLVTSSCIDPVDGTVHALGYLRRIFWKSQTQVTAAEQTFEVHSLDSD